MIDIDELNRSVGRLEGKTDILVHNQDRLIEAVGKMNKTLNRKVWYDSAKVISGAFAGGFMAVVMKFAIWK